jgi:GMP synthase (glutamine-hydrolysing)
VVTSADSSGRLRVGLLLCDHLDPEVAAIDGDYTELYPAAFAPAGIDLQVFDVTAGDLPASTDDFDGWVTSGSRRSAYEDADWIPELRSLVRRLADEERPQVGICFGHQVAALALGGDVARAEGGWGVGAREFDVVAPAPWMEPDAAPFRILMSHQDQVVRLPADAELVATADYCPVGAYRVGERLFCVQGHPEFTPGVSRSLTTRRRAVIGDEAADVALRSLERPLDHARVVGWMAAMLRRARR